MLQSDSIEFNHGCDWEYKSCDTRVAFVLDIFAYLRSLEILNEQYGPMAYRILRERKSDDGFALHLGRTFSSEALHRALLGVFGVQTVREWPLIFLCEHLTEGI